MSEEYPLSQKCAAEALGTGMIVTGGCGMVCAARYAAMGAVSSFTIPAIFGIAVTAAVYSTRDISGAHLNPAVTAAFAVCRPEAMPAENVVPYFGAQLAGATIGGALNYAMFNNGIKALEKAEGTIRGAKGSCATFSGAFGMIANKTLCPKPGHVFLAEAGMTGALLFTVFALTDSDKSVPEGAVPGLVGATVTALACQFGPVTGCGMNPARDLGPRIVTYFGGWRSAALSYAWWGYTLGPMVGGILGATLYNVTLKKKQFNELKQ